MKGLLTLQKASLEDIEFLAQLDQSTNSDAWTIGQYRDSMVADHHHIVLTPNKTAWAVWTQVIDEGELLRLAVIPTHRHQGLGYQLLQTILQRAQSNGMRRMFLEVRPSNTNAIRLYERCEFKPYSKRKNYYQTPDGFEDALLMKKTWQ